MNILEKQQIHDNRVNTTKFGLWADFRDRMKIIIQKTDEKRSIFGGRALLLGAGNGNDIPLDLIEASFEEIVLVDIDKDALNRLIQKVKNPNKFTLVIADLSGVADQLPLSFIGKSDKDVIKLLNGLTYDSKWTKLIQGKFDFIMNCHFTTQLISPVISTQVKSAQIPLSPVNIAMNELIMKVITGLLTSIYELLGSKAVFLHSTDTFELSFDGSGNPIRPGTEEIVSAVNGDLNMLHNITPILLQLTKKGYAVSGSALPDEWTFKHFNHLAFFINPWNFEQTAAMKKYYVVYSFAFEKK